tara:strand:+ start:215 stop:1111 length:897 start_codon:yes stop_codon:yes gene_type:complete
MVNIGINIESSIGIGDKIQWTTIPESFYKYYGVKLIDAKKSWVFDHNPYVRRDVDGLFNPKFRDLDGNETSFPCLYCLEEHWINPNEKSTHDLTVNGDIVPVTIKHLWQHRNFEPVYSRAEWFNKILGIQSWHNRHLDFPRSPRLYKFDDPKNVKPTQISIHVGPSNNNSSQYIPDFVLKKIKERYTNYNIVQIGSKKDFDSPFEDKRGLDIWETVKTIAQSAIFIGVNSGPMNIANCYPHISKKLIMNREDHWEKKLDRFQPLDHKTSESFGWADLGWQYYVTDENDVNSMYSYKRI